MVGRVKTGIQPAQVETELRQIMVESGVGRKGSRVYATPLRAAVNRPLWQYGGLFAAVLSASIVWAGIGVWRVCGALRYWTFFVAKSILTVLALFLFVFERVSIRLGTSGGIWWGRELVALWLLFCGVALLAAWAWRDQKRRCRTCLMGLRDPLRIGTSGQMLLDPSGEEIMCPRGHGSVYTSQSFIGRELADRWITLSSK